MSEKNESGMHPIGIRVVVKRKEQKTVRASGIILPQAIKGDHKPSEGEIIAVGDQVEVVSIGQKVLWGQYAGVDKERNGTQYVVMNDEDILASVDNYDESEGI